MDQCSKGLQTDFSLVLLKVSRELREELLMLRDDQLLPLHGVKGLKHYDVSRFLFQEGKDLLKLWLPVSLEEALSQSSDLSADVGNVPSVMQVK